MSPETDNIIKDSGPAGSAASGARSRESAPIAAEEILESIADGFIALDPEWRFVYVNSAAERILRRSRAELLGRNQWEIYPQALGKAVEIEYRQAMADRQPRTFDFQFGELWFGFRLFPSRDGGLIVYFQNITERKSIERTLLRHSRVLESMTEGVSVADENGIILYTNPAEDAIFGYGPGELIGKHVTVQNTYDADENVRRVAEVIETLKRSGSWTGEWSNRKKDGSQFFTFARISALELEGKRYWVCVQEDITERKRTQDALRESEQKFRLLADAAPVMIWETDARREATYFNQPWLDFTGRTLKQELGSGWTENVHPEDLARVMEVYEAAFDSRESFQMEFRLRRYDGSYHWILNSGVPHISASGELTGYFGSCIDIHDRKTAEQALRINAERFRVALQNAPMAVFNQGLDLRYTWAHNKHPKFRPEVLLGKTDWELNPSSGISELTEAKREVLKTGTGVRREFTIPVDGKPAFYDITLEPLFDEQGAVTGLTGAAINITSQKESEQRLRESEERFRRIVETAAEGIWIVDLEGRTTFANPRMAELLGLPVEQILGKPCFDFIHPSDVQRARQGFAQRAEGDVSPREYRFVHSSGAEIWLDFVASPMRDASGKTSGILGMCTDVTERRRAEEALRAREEESRALLAALPDVISRFDHTLRFQYISPSVQTITGVPPEHFLGKTHMEAGLPDTLSDLLRSSLTKVFSTGIPDTVEFEFPAADGIRHLVGLAVPERGASGEVSSVLSIVRDNTERRNAEEALRASEQRLALAVRTRGIGIFDWNIKTGELHWSDQSERMFGLEPGQFEGVYSAWARRVHPDDIAAMQRLLAGAMERREDHLDFAYRFVAPDSSVRYLEGSGRFLYGRDGQAERMVGVNIDVTERQLATQELSRLNQDLARRIKELETLLDVTPIGICIAYDAQCRRIRVNRAFAAWVDVDPALNVSRSGSNADRLPYRVFKDGRELKSHELPMQVAAGEGRQVEAEIDLVRDDGRVVRIFGFATPLFDEHGGSRGSVGAFVDVTERNAMEDALRRANADLEQFAYAAAHDLQEPVRTVSLYTQLLAKKYRGKFDSEADELLRFTVESSRRMQSLIQDLLAYTRAVNAERQENERADAGLVMDAVLQNLRTAIELSGADVSYGPLPEVAVPEAQLTQVFQNLVSNSLKYRGVDPPLIEVSAEPRGAEWLFTVRDNGIGIPSEHHDRIFRVFKRLHGREIPGTGIGLAICQRIVKHCGGRMWVESEPGHGAAFRFTLPAARAGQ